MDSNNFIGDLIHYMIEYQKENNIKRECVANARYLYDNMKMYSINNVKTKAVLVYSSDDKKCTGTIVSGHLVVQLDNDLILDPSYDVSSRENTHYFSNVKEFIDLHKKQNVKINFDVKKLIRDLTDFIKISERINAGYETTEIYKGKHYKDQADHIDKIYAK